MNIRVNAFYNTALIALALPNQFMQYDEYAFPDNINLIEYDPSASENRSLG